MRESVRLQKHIDEELAVQQLLDRPPYDPALGAVIEDRAVELVQAARRSEISKPLLDTFLTEYGLSSSEGVALMCLAESLLRVPDRDTADLLIADKLGDEDWSEHLGQADSLLVNASTWALMLTGRVVELDQELARRPGSWMQKLIARVSEPVVQGAVRTAMDILGREFVLGETIEEALRHCDAKGAYSFDMLGEGARSMDVAERYAESYQTAIERVGQHRAKLDASVSIKLSALHPRYEAAQRDRVLAELVPRVGVLCATAQQHGLAIAIDAEEADRLELSLDVLQQLTAMHGADNVGFVVQAYSKRAPAVLDWLLELSHACGRVIPVRLVKGAYWDAEIKHAQMNGYDGFPVYTRKSTTDVAYLACARKIFDHPQALYGQFATHNAHTVCAILEMGREGDFEFQRLHGMGEILYATAESLFEAFPRVRTYAPVGTHEDLLAYLVRRLLENGANSSFVNRFMDQGVDARDLVRDPVGEVKLRAVHTHAQIPLPADIYPDRLNSRGTDLSDALTATELQRQVREYRDNLMNSAADGQPGEFAVRAPHDQTLLASVRGASVRSIASMVDVAAMHQRRWNDQGASYRAACLRRLAMILEDNQPEFVSLLVLEAGKTLRDAVDEVREAVDFCRFYANESQRLFGDATTMPGPTGEENTFSLSGRGVWACISPWNFPLAIFLGQVTAALAAGNAVIAKPAEETPLIARRVIQAVYEAGVPEEVCQLAVGGPKVGQALVEHPAIGGVAFTGGTDTARSINAAMSMVDRPITPLIAETGGLNAMIVDSTALLEQVTDDVIESAFRSAGQRCSALRVLFLQEDISDRAIELIVGAMNELKVGDPTLLSTDVGPVISDTARRALVRHIEAMRSRGWVRHALSLDDRCDAGNFVPPTLIELPAIDVLDREHFGPILHVVRFAATEMETVVEDINRTGYALTLGVHTRIEARASYIAEHAKAGNIYINRNMVGAVVGTQPFGGQGKSGTGPKAGGPNYLARFATERVVTTNTVASGGNARLLTLSAET